MTRTITKRADELRPGDVVSPVTWGMLDGPRLVMLRAIGSDLGNDGILFGVLGVRDVNRPTDTRFFSPADEVVVEMAPNLTRAQEQADELAQRLEWLLGFVETYAREHMGPATPEFNKVRDVLARALPPNAPTLEESLEALAVLSDGLRAVHVGDWDGASMQVARNQAHEVVRRARAAGVIP